MADLQACGLKLRLHYSPCDPSRMTHRCRWRGHRSAQRDNRNRCSHCKPRATMLATTATSARARASSIVNNARRDRLCLAIVDTSGSVVVRPSMVFPALCSAASCRSPRSLLCFARTNNNYINNFASTATRDQQFVDAAALLVAACDFNRWVVMTGGAGPKYASIGSGRPPG
jgi:hypothetical protein